MTANPMMDPDQVDNALKGNDTEDFESLVTSHQHRLYFYIRSMVFNPDDAKDVLQDVNVILVRKREHFIPGREFMPWAFGIARFECLTYLARRKKLQWVALDSGFLEALADHAEERIEDVEPWLSALAECKRMLSEESLGLLEIRYRDREMLELAAERLKTTTGAMKQKLFRIRNFLKNCILKRRNGEFSTLGMESL